MVQVAIVSSGQNTGSKPVQDPKMGGFVVLLALMAAIGGLLFGYDTGVVSSAMLYIPDDPEIGSLNNIFKGLIVSITPGMAGIGSIIAGPTSDAFGRKKTIMVSSGLFTIGAVVCAAAINRYFLLIGRIILGLAIGIASMIVPIYVSEVSPAHVRGRLITSFQLMITFGLVFSNIAAGGFSYINPTRIGWRLMVGFAGVPSLIQLMGFLFLPESPRYLVNQGRDNEAKKVLDRIYNGQDDWVKYEMDEIKASHKEERKAKLEHEGDVTLMRVLKTPHVRKALMIGSLLQMFQQLGGINTLMYYTGTIIRSTGIKDKHTTIWIACGISSLKLTTTFIPLYLIERIGRRVMLLISIGVVIISQLLMGAGFLLINKDSAALSSADYINGFSPNDSFYLAHNPSWNKTLDTCMAASNCDSCVTMEKCGYCDWSKSSNDTKISGQCLPVHINDNTLSQIGVCSSTNNLNENGGSFSWANAYCKTKYTVIPIVIMVFYLIGFSSGYGPVPWVFNAEVYPLWARSTCVSFTTFINWTFNLIISLTFLTLTEAVTKYGAFFLYAAITLVGFVVFFALVPETRGVPIEEVEMLFMSKAKRREMKMQLERNNGRKEGGVTEKADESHSYASSEERSTN
uniref:Major facilitator superfamily (MFS) profile domain-containing protein n=1 Tax=Plectus sambesii TaxID=2011161 RepID=A0A914UWE4_9BILA